ncbi:MAG TPA: hypothetical protein VLA91_14490 [Acidimicrobiia bacterium]|nr:hypothetical protein [Acidimicrobiia bacterium]
MTPNSTTRPLERTSTTVVVLLAAVCIAWVVVALIHPTSLIDDDIPTWMVVHIAQLVFAPIVALAILALLKGIKGPAATVARGAAVLWAAWFSAYDAVAGIATGILIGGDARATGEYLFAHVLITGLGWVAPGMWLLAVIPAGLALRASGAPTVTYVALLASALVFTHAGPPAAVGFAALAVALWSGLTMGDRSGLVTAR